MVEEDTDDLQRQRKMEENEAAFLNSIQTVNHGQSGGNDSGEQIDSSDEYDPAQDVQDISLTASNQAPVTDSPHASRPASAHSTNVSATQAANQQPGPESSMQPSVIQSPSTTSTVKPNGTPFASQPPQAMLPRVRLPHDTVGILEDRIKEDEKGDTEAWLSLINEYKRRGKIDEVRKVYDRFFAVFPQTAEQWVAYAQLENEVGNRVGVEAIFNKVLKDLPHLQLWCTYLDHIRRHYNIAVDKSGTASQTNHAAYEAVLDVVGIDKDAGKLWQDYILFIKSGPGVVGQSDWQGQQKMDLLRKAYQRAVCIPTQAVEAIWKDYTNFEMSLNKMTGRKFLQEKSPDYMSARSSYTELQNITSNLKRSTLPALPPALGFDGDVEYTHQVEIWKRWIQWEKTDPLVLKEENPTAYKARIIYVYKHALLALRFWPEMWFDAAEFCFNNDLDDQGTEFLTQGIRANPESCLLAFKYADRLELSTSSGNDDNSKQQRGMKVREPYDNLLNSLYDLVAKAMEREQRDIARIEEQSVEAQEEQSNGIDDDEEDDNERKLEKENRKKAQVASVKAMNSVQISILNRTISYAWIALMRAMQRIQGKGNVKDASSGGSRKVFTDARRRGRITGELWVAAAMLEFHSGDSEAAKKIFERGLKLFPADESFALEYMKLLTNANDHTNARAVFETTVSRLSQKPETQAKVKPLYSFFHQYESHYGELAQIIKLEARMREAFPDDPKLHSFSQRFAQSGFDPTAIRPLISVAAQTRPKVLPTIEAPSRKPSPVPARTLQVENSPKRPAPLDDLETDLASRPRKVARGESPLAGAAGRRLNQLKSRQPFDSTPPNGQGNPYPQIPPLPRDITFLLSIIPPASTYNAAHFKVDEIIRLLRETPIPTSVSQLPPPHGPNPGMPQLPHGPPNPLHGTWPARA